MDKERVKIISNLGVAIALSGSIVHHFWESDIMLVVEAIGCLIWLGTVIYMLIHYKTYKTEVWMFLGILVLIGIIILLVLLK